MFINPALASVGEGASEVSAQEENEEENLVENEEETFLDSDEDALETYLDNSESEFDDEYKVEAILGKRQLRTGTFQYKVKWKGFNPDEGGISWEPIENCQCPELITKFEEELKAGKHKLRKQQRFVKRRKRKRN